MGQRPTRGGGGRGDEWQAKGRGIAPGDRMIGLVGTGVKPHGGGAGVNVTPFQAARIFR
jgi:hypothetical protein